MSAPPRADPRRRGRADRRRRDRRACGSPASPWTRGVSTALVHYHFATREALLAEALDALLRAGRRRPRAEGDPVTRLRDMIEQCLPLPGEQEQRLGAVGRAVAARRPPPRAAPDRREALRAHARVVPRGDRGGAPSATPTPPRPPTALLALIDGFGVRALLGDPGDAARARPRGGLAALAGDLGCATAPQQVSSLNRRFGELCVSPRPSTAHVRRPAILQGRRRGDRRARRHQNTRIPTSPSEPARARPGVLYWFPPRTSCSTEALAFADDRFYDRADRPSSTAARQRAARGWRGSIELWPAEGDGETVLWMELWVRALRDPELATRRASGSTRRWRDAIADVVRDGQATGEFGGGRRRGVGAHCWAR